MFFTRAFDAESTSSPIKAGKINEAPVESNKKNRPNENSTL